MNKLLCILLYKLTQPDIILMFDQLFEFKNYNTNLV